MRHFVQQISLREISSSKVASCVAGGFYGWTHWKAGHEGQNDFFKYENGYFSLHNWAKISFLLAFKEVSVAVLISITDVSSAFTSWLTGAFDYFKC